MLATSFPIANLSRPGSLSSTRLAEVVAQLEYMGYTVRFRDVYLGENGGWRGLLVGAYSTIEEAQAEAERLRQNPDFADAKASRY